MSDPLSELLEVTEREVLALRAEVERLREALERTVARKADADRVAMKFQGLLDFEAERRATLLAERTLK